MGSLRIPKLTVRVQLQLGWNTYLPLNHRCVRGDEVGWGRNSYSGPADIASFSRWDFRQNNKYDKFWHIVSTGYRLDSCIFLFHFHEPLRLQILATWKFRLSLVCYRLYSMKPVFISKYTLRFLIFKLDLNVKHHPCFFK